MKCISRMLTMALVIGAIAIAGSSKAQAALVVVLSDGVASDTTTFTSAGNALGTLPFTIGPYTGTIQAASTNFAGTPIMGTLTTTTQITLVDGPPVAGPLVVNAGVFVNTTGPTFGGLALFTAPTGAILNLKNDVTANGTSQNVAATMAGDSTANGVTSPVVTLSVNAAQEASTNVLFGPSPYTLQNHYVITGLVSGDSALSFSVASTVTSVVPEPTTLATALSALPILGFIALRRNRRKPA